jgi:hypothetical protein
MRIALGTFAMSALEARVGADVPAAINTALSYHVAKLEMGRDPVRFPGRLQRASAASGAQPELEVEVDDRVEATLRADATRQGVSPADLAGHAVLVYLAELDRLGSVVTPG